MALRSLVKICAVTNLSDARYAAGMGVELMGFDLEPDSESYVAPQEFEAITGWVSGVKIVGELQEADAERLKDITHRYHLDYIQVNGSNFSADLLQCPLPLIIKLDRPDHEHIESVLSRYSQQAAWFLFDFAQADCSYELLELSKVWTGKYPIIMGSNISADNVFEMLDLGFAGIALRGGNEIKPGYKDFDELADVLEVLEVD